MRAKRVRFESLPRDPSRAGLLPRVQSVSAPAGREKARRAKELWAILLTTLIILVGALSYVWQHIQVIRIGYEVERLNAELSALTHEEKELTVKIAQLKSLARIDEIARKRLRMVDPAPSQIILFSGENQSNQKAP